MDLLATTASVAGVASLVAGIMSVVYARRQARGPSRVEQSKDLFVRERSSLAQNRFELGKTAARLHLAACHDLERMNGTDFLTRRALGVTTPIPLDRIQLDLQTQPLLAAPELIKAAGKILPLRGNDGQYASYSEAIAALCRPSLFENSLSYRLLDLDFSGATPRMSFGTCRYFDMIDIAEALAHELHYAVSSGKRVLWSELPLRSMFRTDPLRLHDHAVLPSIATLTLIRTPSGEASFVMHWRDPAKVSISANLYQVVPAGVFQPTSDVPGSATADLSLWQNIMREYAEELGNIVWAGGGPGIQVDYSRVEPCATLERGLRAGGLSVWFLGAGIDPLTLTCELLTAAVFDEQLFRDAFPQTVNRQDAVLDNSEGRLIVGPFGEDQVGIRFERSEIDSYLANDRLTPSAAACLGLAWDHRDLLLGRSGATTSLSGSS